MQTMSPNHTPDTASVFQLKGSMLAITVLELARNDLEALDRQLAAKVAQAPNFFSNTPLVLALDKLPADEGAIDLPGLMRICRHHGLRTLAIRANRIEDIAAAIAIDLPVLPPSGPANGRWSPSPRWSKSPNRPRRHHRPPNPRCARPASLLRQYAVANRSMLREVIWL